MKNWHRTFHEVIFEAHRRAAITGYRYRVRYDSRNRWWEMRETTTYLWKR